MTVVLLTGGGAFVDPSTGTYSEKLAHTCDMGFLRDSPDWQQVRSRPKSFVHRLLVLDEAQRMTAPQALCHEWFFNEVHKTNFEELYQRTIKHWRPSPHRRDIVEFRGASCVQSLMFPRRSALEPDTKERPVFPVDAHCKPVPKKMYSNIWPKKSKANSLVLGEVQAAIRRWPSKRETQELVDDEDVGGEDDELLAQKTRRRDLLSPNSARCQSRIGQGQRSVSAHPRLTRPLLCPLTPQLPNVAKFRSPSTALNPALVRLQTPQVTTKRFSTIFNGGQSPLREYTSSSGADANIDAEKEPARAEAGPPVDDVVTSAVRDQTAERFTEPRSRCPSKPETDQSTRPDNSRQLVDTEISSAIVTAPLTALLPPVRADKLKRWLTSPTQDPTRSRSSSKRRRGSVFDIEEDIDGDTSRTHERAVERTKKVCVLRDTFDHANDKENAAQDDEITLTHHPVSLRISQPGLTGDGLYLPR